MKIMTIAKRDPDSFDEYVNKALEEGYQIEHRAVLQTNRDEILYYAQLVLPDQAPEPEAFDPGLALHHVQTFCHSVDQNDCGTDRCPLNGWCQRLRDCADPTDWDLSEVVPF